jgi:hypothetical protein
MENNKNIWLLPTNEPSRLYFNNNDKNLQFCKVDKKCTPLKINQNIYITSDEEIKEGDWYIYGERILQAKFTHKPLYKVKIILTTDTKLITDGVQAIEDEFLEWFVKNPSCERVEVKKGFADGSAYGYDFLSYKIIIPKEEPKPFKDMQQLTEVDWKKFKKKPFISKKEPKQGTMSEAIKQDINNQLKQETVMENKTPMQELIDELEEILSVSSNPLISMNLRLNIELAKSKLEKEKQVIEDAVDDQVNRYSGMATFRTNGKDYYNEKFNKNE